jgi:hypothetical protein
VYLGSSGAVAVTHATIARNRASSSNPFNGGGVASEDEVEEEAAVNTVLAENLPTNCGQWGLDSAGHNLADDASCGLGGPGDLEGVDAQLGPLGDFGGPTRSILPLPGSPAVEGGTDAGILVDQRGVTWPQLAQFDMGAVERRARRERESFPGGSVARPHRRDLDRGGRVDFADLDRLAAPLAAGAPPASTGAGNRAAEATFCRQPWPATTAPTACSRRSTRRTTGSSCPTFGWSSFLAGPFSSTRTKRSLGFGSRTTASFRSPRCCGTVR